MSGTNITSVTVQWCMITESLNDSYHHKGKHGYGSLVRADGGVSYHHNLYAHHSNRTPRPGTYGSKTIRFDFRNNVIYDGRGYSSADPVEMNFVANYMKPGPRTEDPKLFHIGGKTTRIYAADNFLEGKTTPSVSDWDLMGNARPENKANVLFPAAPVATANAHEAYRQVLASAGATLPERDAVDKRIVEEVRNGTGRLINSQAEVGGWPELIAVAAPLDADDDGMPDAWEKRQALDPKNPSDGAKDEDGDGYTNLEEFLNGTDPRKSDA